MKKGRKVNKMTDMLIPFSYPKIEEGVSKDLVAPNVSPVFRVTHIIWGRLLEIDNETIRKDTLFYATKVIEQAENTLQDFRANKHDLKKYPKFEDSDWEI